MKHVVFCSVAGLLLAGCAAPGQQPTLAPPASGLGSAAAASSPASTRGAASTASTPASATARPAPSPAPTPTPMPTRITLSRDGVGKVAFGTTKARAMPVLQDLLGSPSKTWRELGQTYVRWGGFTVKFRDEDSALWEWAVEPAKGAIPPSLQLADRLTMTATKAQLAALGTLSTQCEYVHLGNGIYFAFGDGQGPAHKITAGGFTGCE